MTKRRLRGRRIETEAFETGKDTLLVTGRLVDTSEIDVNSDVLVRPKGIAHDIRVEVELKLPDFTVTALRVDMYTVPYEGCQGILPLAQKLVGTRITSGFASAAKGAVGGARGCPHLTTLLQALPTIAMHGGITKLREDHKEDPEGVDESFLLNSCHMWRAGGKLASIQFGDK